MLRVTVELVPFGEEAHKRTLSTLIIGNTGEGDARMGHYRITYQPGEPGYAHQVRTLRDFARTAGHLALVEEAIRCLRLPPAVRRARSFNQ